MKSLTLQRLRREKTLLVLTGLRSYPSSQIAPWSLPEGLTYLGHLTPIIRAMGHDLIAGHLSVAHLVSIVQTAQELT